MTTQSSSSSAIVKPPVVGQALNDISALQYPDSSLAPFLGEFERLLMFNTSAAPALDSVPFGPPLTRFSTLVTAARAAFAENPAFGDMIRRMGPALVKDRAARSNGELQAEDIVEAVQELSRTVPTRSYQPRY